jgi:hypothetical protein
LTKATATADSWGNPRYARISLILLVGAGRFERPTPCAQGRFRRFAKIAYFLLLRLQAVTESMLKVVERFGTRGLWHPHFYLQRFRYEPDPFTFIHARTEVISVLSPGANTANVRPKFPNHNFHDFWPAPWL